MLRCRPTVTNRGQFGRAKRTDVSRPSTTLKVMRTSADQAGGACGVPKRAGGRHYHRGGVRRCGGDHAASDGTVLLGTVRPGTVAVGMVAPGMVLGGIPGQPGVAASESSWRTRRAGRLSPASQARRTAPPPLFRRGTKIDQHPLGQLNGGAGAIEADPLRLARRYRAHHPDALSDQDEIAVIADAREGRAADRVDVTAGQPCRP